MNLDEVKAFTASEDRLAEIGAAYRAAQDGQDHLLYEDIFCRKVSLFGLRW
jgi:hypothetical protein